MSWAGGMAPAADRWAVSCDFDGTITCEDMVQAMLARFADPAWREVEAEWEAGLIGARECLARQTDMLRVEEAELASWVDEQPVDPDVGGFLSDCARRGHEVRIVSDGYDWVIARVLARLELSHLPVFANRLRPSPGRRWSLEFPYARATCPSGACKCKVLGADAPRLHVGDGRSDFCVADVCERVFAKGALLAARRARGLPSVAFDTFADLHGQLDLLTASEATDDTARLQAAVG